VIAVIGGGITGAFSAYFAARLGADVVLIERAEPGTTASSNNPGGLNPLHGAGIPGPLDDLARFSFSLHKQTWPELRAASTPDFAGRPAHRLELAVDDAAAARLQAAGERYAAAPGFDAEWLDRDAVHRLEPRLTAEVVGGIATAGNLRVDSAAYTTAVTQAAVKNGARLIRGQVDDLEASGGTVTSVVTSDGAIHCDALVVATGPWCDAPARWLGVRLPVEPVLGELLLVASPDPLLDREVTHGTIGLYPRPDGSVWLGGTEDRVGFDAQPTEAGAAAIREGVARLISGIDTGAVLGRTAALRPVTADGLPIAGPALGWHNVALALGGGRKGMLLSAGLGRAAADLLTGGQTDVPIAGLAADRPGLVA
jgi:glycine oxidase